MGLDTYKMVKFFISFIIFFIINFNTLAQKLYIPISDPEIINIYKTGNKSPGGEYLSKDSEGKIRIKGKFNKLIPVGKWYIFFKDGSLMAYYNYNEEGQLDGIFVEYH